jgi:DNA-binding transcriptional ArsR family regulator
VSNLQTQSNPGPKGLANEQNVEQLIALFKLLSDRTRLQILLLLAAG